MKQNIIYILFGLVLLTGLVIATQSRVTDVVSYFETISTGNGTTEIFPQNQNLRTTDSPSFVNLTSSDYILASNIDATGTIAGATINTGQGANEVYAQNQNLRTTDSPSFANITTECIVLTNGAKICGI